jgi:predicted Zn-dependent protease
MLVSEQSAIAQSESAYSSLIAGLGESGQLSKDKKLIARVQKITDRLITEAVSYRSETKDWKWSIEVIDEPETVNAFCMAGGKMAIYTGLINKVEPTDDEIAQVMGHEISHALASHSAEKMSVRLAAELAVVAVTATANQENKQVANDVSSLAALALITLPNSREAESEADRIGIELAAKAGYDPHAAVTLWEKMMKATGQKSRFDFLSTHPASPKRVEALAALESKMNPIYEAWKSSHNLPDVGVTTDMPNPSGSNKMLSNKSKKRIRKETQKNL